METEGAAGLSSSTSTILSSTQLHNYKQYKEEENLVLRCHKITSQKKVFRCLTDTGPVSEKLIISAICSIYGDAFAQLKNLSLIFTSDLCLMRMFAVVCKASNTVI